MTTLKQRASQSTPQRDDLQQDLEEDLSRIVHEYSSRGLSPSKIMDSMSFYMEVAATQTQEEPTVEDYVKQ